MKKGLYCTVYIIYLRTASSWCLLCCTGSNWFIGGFGAATIHSVSAQTSQEGIECFALESAENVRLQKLQCSCPQTQNSDHFTVQVLATVIQLYLLHVPRLPPQPTSSRRGWVIDFIWLELPQQYIAMTRNNLTHWFKYVYGTPEKMSAAFSILKLYNFNISIL